MPRCDHPGAECIIGNFYTCRTTGCPNGPARPKSSPSRAVSDRSGMIPAAALGNLSPGQHRFGSGPLLYVMYAPRSNYYLSISADGYEFMWGYKDATDPDNGGRWHAEVKTRAGDQTNHGCPLFWRKVAAAPDDDFF